MTSTPPLLQVQLLGAFRVLVAGRVIPEGAWRGRRSASLVKLLALAGGHRLHREQAMDALWPNLDPDAQANNLNVAASRARQALAAAGAPEGTFIVRAGETLVLGPPEAVQIDVERFETAVAAAHHGDDPSALRAALALYTGELLPDEPFEDWIADRRATLRTDLLSLLDRLGRLSVVRGETGDAIAAYERLLAADHAHEEAHVALMRLYAQTGQRGRALEQFDRLTATLDHELGVKPDRAAHDLAESIRSGRYPEPGQTVSTTPTAQSAADVPDLPNPLDDLVGRAHEIAAIRHLLTHGRLVTLTGPGGIGKTRLAIAVGHQARPDFPDGVAFVDLSSVRDPELVLSTLAHHLGVREVSGRPSVGGVAAHFRDRRFLLVLDNFEQVTGAAAVVTDLLERAIHLRILVTSRVPLRVRGETEYPVPSLALPEAAPNSIPGHLLASPAVSLFVQRAQATKPTFTVTDENAAAIGEICARLDGLPLAIELAAARVKVLTPAAMLSRLDRPLTLLAGGRHDLPERQQTIRNTITWSHNLLSAPEQRLLWRLSVFAGGWTLETAEVIGAEGGGREADYDSTERPTFRLPPSAFVLDGLASLVDKNLIHQRELADGEIRFGMLETIREFAAERLAESGEEPEIRRRHAAAFVALAEQSMPALESTDLVRALERLDREDGNLREALTWLRAEANAELALRLVVALRNYWFIRGRLVEGCATTLDVAALPTLAPFTGLRIDALNGAGFFAREYGDFDRAHAISIDALAASRHLGDRKREADALVNLGYVALQRGAFDTARDLFDACLHANRVLGNGQGIADALAFLGLTAYYTGDLPTARQLDEESLALWEALGDVQAVVWARTRLGEVLLRQGEHPSAYRELMSALVTARELDFWWGYSWAFDGLAQLASATRQHRLAASLAAEAAAIREDVGLRLPPTEQVEVDRLRHHLEQEVGAAAFMMPRTERGKWRVDELIATVRATLGATGEAEQARATL